MQSVEHGGFKRRQMYSGIEIERIEINMEMVNGIPQMRNDITEGSQTLQVTLGDSKYTHLMK